MRIQSGGDPLCLLFVQYRFGTEFFGATVAICDGKRIVHRQAYPAKMSNSLFFAPRKRGASCIVDDEDKTLALIQGGSFLAVPSLFVGGFLSVRSCFDCTFLYF